VIPALGGAERKIADAYVIPTTDGRTLDWSPDGRYLVVADRMGPQDPRVSILLLSVETAKGRYWCPRAGPSLRLRLSRPTARWWPSSRSRVPGPGYFCCARLGRCAPPSYR